MADGRILLDLSAESKELLELLRREQKTRTEAVRQMFVEVLPHQERNDRPTVPSEAAIRLQTRIDAEEFVEKIEAMYDNPVTIEALRLTLDLLAKHSPIRSDLHDRLPEFADALADNAVTNEGFAVLFGLDLESVFQEVHASNMRKADGPIDETGKKRKPKGWVGPDVVGVLRRQGWQPSSESEVDEPIPYALAKPFIEHCSVHGHLTGDQVDDELKCIRCENAQYGGSEVDPIGEQSDNETTALAYPANESAKVDVGPQKEPQRRAIPIDRTLWSSLEKIELDTALVQIEDRSIVCVAKFYDRGNGRRFSIEFLANDETIKPFTQLHCNRPLSARLDGVDIGPVRLVGFNEGIVRDDKKTFKVWIEFVQFAGSVGG